MRRVLVQIRPPAITELSIPRFPFPPISELLQLCLQAFSFDVIRSSQRKSPPLNRRSAAVSPTLPALLLLCPLGSTPGGSSLVETVPRPGFVLCPLSHSRKLLVQALLAGFNRRAAVQHTLLGSSHGEHPRKCNVHPHLWYDLCRRAAGIARMAESLGSDLPRFRRPIRFSFTLFYFVMPGRFFPFLVSSFYFIFLVFLFHLWSRAPPDVTPSFSCIRLLPAVYI